MKNSLILFLVLFTRTVFGVNNDTIPGIDKTAEIYEQEAGYYLNHLDSFVINTYYKSIVEKEWESRTPLDSSLLIKPENRDSLYAIRLGELDKNSPFDFAYNPYIGAFIDLYVYRKRELTENCLGLASYYFPIFEEALDKYNLPIEFKYLAIVESALNVRARSRAGAAGLWQFMYRTGLHYDLTINSYVDERYEIYAATDAACRFFTDLYKIYGNWELVIAAYNCGPGNVNKAIRRSGGKKTYWEIRTWLPRETRGYVPAFIAVNYAMNYNEEHGLKATFPDSLDLLTDTICVKGPLDLSDIGNYFCANMDQLWYLNPSYKTSKIPDDNRSYVLRMPIGLMNAYITYKEGFENYIETQEKEENVVVTAPVKSAPSARGTENIHIVQSGEVLGVIAEKYGVGLSQVKDWNNLYSSRIYEGQKLVIYTDKKVDQQPAAKPVVKSSPKDNPAYKYHVIRPGDTLWDIAKLYDGLTVTELKRLNQGVNYKKLKPGDKLIVSANS